MSTSSLTFGAVGSCVTRQSRQLINNSPKRERYKEGVKEMLAIMVMAALSYVCIVFTFCA